MSFLSEGKEVERKFAELYAKLYSDNDIIFSTNEEDINEHWDVQISGLKYDVKGVKKVRRDDSFPNELYHFIELKNVNGDDGWLYGKADFFVFETFKYFIIVSDEKLRNFVTEKITDTVVNSVDKSLYCLYTRTDRKDLITMITSIDLMLISHDVIEKKENTHFKLGESVIDAERIKEKMKNIFNK